jgi:hypothetical protein
MRFVEMKSAGIYDPPLELHAGPWGDWFRIVLLQPNKSGRVVRLDLDAAKVLRSELDQWIAFHDDTQED